MNQAVWVTLTINVPWNKKIMCISLCRRKAETLQSSTRAAAKVCSVENPVQKYFNSLYKSCVTCKAKQMISLKNEHLIKLIPMRNVHAAEKLPFWNSYLSFKKASCTTMLAATSSNWLILVWPFHFFSSIVRLQKEVFFLYEICFHPLVPLIVALVNVFFFQSGIFFWVSSNCISLRPSPPSHSLST